MYLCSVIINKSINKKNKTMDEGLEMRIKFLETLLNRYRELSERAGISFKSQEETIDKLLDELDKLYKQRKN